MEDDLTPPPPPLLPTIPTHDVSMEDDPTSPPPVITSNNTTEDMEIEEESTALAPLPIARKRRNKTHVVPVKELLNLKRKLTPPSPSSSSSSSSSPFSSSSSTNSSTSSSSTIVCNVCGCLEVEGVTEGERGWKWLGCERECGRQVWVHSHCVGVHVFGRVWSKYVEFYCKEHISKFKS